MAFTRPSPLLAVLIVSLCVAGSLAAAAHGRVHLERGVGFAGDAPPGWLHLGRADPIAKVTLTLAGERRAWRCVGNSW